MPDNRPYYPLPPKLERLEAYLCLAANVDRETLHTPIRDRDYADVRQAIWYIAREYMGYSFPALARLYGRDHTTVIHGVERMKVSPERERIVNAIKDRHPDLLEHEPRTSRGGGMGSWNL